MKLSTMCILINYLSVNEYCSAEALNPNNVLKTTEEAKLAGSSRSSSNRSSSNRSCGSRRQKLWQQETAAMAAVVEAAKTAAVAEKVTAAAAAV